MQVAEVVTGERGSEGRGDSFGRSLEEFFERLYARYSGKRYLLVLLAFAAVNGLIGIALGGVALRFFLRVSLEETVAAAVACVLGGALSLALLWWFFIAPDGEMLSRWRASPNRRDAPAIWNATTRLTYRWVVIGVAIFAAVFLPVALWIRALAELPWSSMPAAYAIIANSILFAATLDFIGIELLFRPVRRHVAEYLPVDFQPKANPVSLRTRLLVVFMVASVATSVLVASIAGEVDSRGARLTIGVGVAIVIAATFGLLPATILARSEGLSRRALMDAARRVEKGDLDVSIPLINADETAGLAASFNRMITGLRERATLRAENVGLVSELQASRNRIVKSSDEARKKVERDLHDGAQQHLVLLDLKLAMAERKVAQGAEGTREVLAEARADLERALAELRDLAHGIYPAALTNDGLAAALRGAAARARLPVAVKADGTGRYRPEVEAAVYFCCLEALQNASKYAGDGARATVHLSATDDRLRFEVSDDGKGFDIASATGSAGLQNMTDRVGALGGEVQLESRPGQGTTVRGSVPL